MLIEISRYQQQHSTRNSFLRASRGVETPIRTKSIGAFGNVNNPPPSSASRVLRSKSTCSSRKKIGHPRPRKRGARPNNGGYTGGSPRPVLKYNTTAAENAAIEALCKG